MGIYWDSKGKYEKKYNELYKKHVPRIGMARTIKGELLRCMSRLYYDYYNNGLCNDKTYEIEFIKNYFDETKINLLFHYIDIGNKEDGYSPDRISKKIEGDLEKLVNIVVKEFN